MVNIRISDKVPKLSWNFFTASLRCIKVKEHIGSIFGPFFDPDIEIFWNFKVFHVWISEKPIFQKSVYKSVTLYKNMVVSYIVSFVLMWASRLCKIMGSKNAYFWSYESLNKNWDAAQKFNFPKNTSFFLADLLKSGYPKCPDGLVKISSTSDQ